MQSIFLRRPSSMCNSNLAVVAAAIIAAHWLLMCRMVNSIQFDLKSGRTKCVAEEIKINAMAVGKFSVVNPNHGYPIPDTHKISLRVSSPHGNNYHYVERVGSGNFAFSAAEAGDYTACFWAVNHKPEVTLIVEFDWRTGVAAKDWSKVVKKGQLEVMEFELKKLSDTISSIHDDMFYLREREEEMQDLKRATNTQMFTFSFLSILVCLSVAGLQLWHLKTYFERKKIL